MEKNKAGQSILAFAFTVSTNLPRDGDAANLSALIRKDGGSFVALMSPTAVPLGGGLYEFTLDYTETNADVLDFKMASSTSGVVVIPQPSARLYTESISSAFALGGESGSNEINFGPVDTPWVAKIYAQGGSTLLYTRTAAAVGTSKVRWTINTSAIPDGSYDIEHELGYGVWAMTIINGVATVYEGWNDHCQATGTGQYVLTITVIDAANSDPLQGVLATLNRPNGSTSWGFTDALGQIKFLANVGSHTVNASLHGYSSAIGQLVSVSGNTLLELSIGTVSTSPPPVTGLCEVTFAITDSGVPVVGAIVHAEVEEPNPCIPNYMVSRIVHDAITDSSGIAVLTMIQRASFLGDGVYKIRVSDANGKRLHDRRVTVPSAATINAVNLTNA
jgi:hypothetical protein